MPGNWVSGKMKMAISRIIIKINFPGPHVLGIKLGTIYMSQ
jgi:hypothetical protein